MRPFTWNMSRPRFCDFHWNSSLPTPLTYTLVSKRFQKYQACQWSKPPRRLTKSLTVANSAGSTNYRCGLTPTKLRSDPTDHRSEWSRTAVTEWLHTPVTVVITQAIVQLDGTQWSLWLPLLQDSQCPAEILTKVTGSGHSGVTSGYCSRVLHTRVEGLFCLARQLIPGYWFPVNVWLW